MIPPRKVPGRPDPFSERTGWDLTPNTLARERAALEARGLPLLDLTLSNPTQAGFRYPEDLLAPLADPAGLRYEPQPRGWLPARQAVASLYAAKGKGVDPERILLTASTSEAYAHLFRLLADPGDQILVPRPSYPLFGYLADLAGVEIVSYPLRSVAGGRWRIDPARLEEAVTPRSRAVVVVHPNNPTGSCLDTEELRRVGALCRRRGLALIADEVFAEYRFSAGPSIPPTLLGGSDALTFALGGLSKLLGLPQMKLGWIAVSGPPGEADPALERLELIADTFLSVNTPVQRAFPGWLRFAPVLQGQILERVKENRRFLEGNLPPGWRLLPSDGGWSAVLKIPGVTDDEAWALSLLKRRQVLVHPGYLFDFEEPGMAVVSLLPPAALFREGIRKCAIE